MPENPGNVERGSGWNCLNHVGNRADGLGQRAILEAQDWPTKARPVDRPRTEPKPGVKLEQGLLRMAEHGQAVDRGQRAPLLPDDDAAVQSDSYYSRPAPSWLRLPLNQPCETASGLCS